MQQRNIQLVVSAVLALIFAALQVNQSRLQTLYVQMAISEHRDEPFIPIIILSQQQQQNSNDNDVSSSTTSSSSKTNNNTLRKRKERTTTTGDGGAGTIDFIPLEATRQAVVEAAETSRNISTSMTPLLFHLIHTTNEESFGKMQKRCLESIFYHHPNAKVILHSKNNNMTTTKRPVQYIIDAGYDLQVKPYDPVDSLERLRKQEVLSDEIIRKFIKRVDGYAKDPEGNWYSNESNLLRMILMYLEGGIYLDTDTIVVKPLDGLPRNVIGFQNKMKTSLNGAIMRFEPGHVYIKACLEEFLTHLKNRLWGANGPRLLTRVYFSKNPEKWNHLEPVDPHYFQYFNYKNIRKDCYEDLRDYKLLQRMNGIREKSYVVHTNNHVRAKIVDGSVCDCLYNTFCLSVDCKKMDHCTPLLETPPKQNIVTGVEYIDRLPTTNMLSLPLEEYSSGKSAPKKEHSPLKIYVYRTTVAASIERWNKTSATNAALMNLFETFPGRTYDATQADLFVVPPSYLDSTMVGGAAPCPIADSLGEECKGEHHTLNASALEFYSDNQRAHVFLLAEESLQSFDVQPFEESLTLSVLGSTKNFTRGSEIQVPTFNPHPALQPSAIINRPSNWWTRPRKYAFTAHDNSVNEQIDLSKLSRAFVKHVRGRKTVGDLPFTLLDPNEVDATEALIFLQESIFCPCFFDGDDNSSLNHFFDAILSGCLPVVPQGGNNKEDDAFNYKFLLPFSSRTNYSEFVIEADASQVSKGSVVQAMKDTIKDKSDLQRRQEKLRDFAVMFSYGLGHDAHEYDDAFQHILKDLEEYLNKK